MTLKEVLSLGRERLRVAGIDEATTETEHMLMHLLGVNRAEVLYLAGSELCSTAEPANKPSLTAAQEKQFFAWIEGREKRIPLAYLLGDVFFDSLKLKVGSGCLIPRPETELLVDCIFSALKEAQPLIADIGCGSGAIALALLSKAKNAKAVLTDVSREALAIARTNAKALNLEERTEFILSDLFTKFSQEWKFDVIVSNPPYLTQADLNQLQPEVAHEPRLALDGGVEGLDFYRRIIKSAGDYLKPHGLLGFELGAGQAGAVKAELEKAGYKEIRVYKDHQQIERVMMCRLGSGQAN